MFNKSKSILTGFFIAGCLSVPFKIQACELYWYLAASMSKPGKAVVDSYNRETKTCKILLVIGGSGQLLSQLKLAGKGDIYTPASEAFLEKAKSLKLVASSRLLLEQRPVFGLSTGGTAKIKSFTDLVNKGNRIALGNPKTMALGKTYLRIEQAMEETLKKAIRANTQLFAININQVVNYLRTNTVDAGIVFDTTAVANGLSYVRIPDEVNVVNRAYLAVLKFSQNPIEVRKFKDYVFRQEGVFKSYGFNLIP